MGAVAMNCMVGSWVCWNAFARIDSPWQTRGGFARDTPTHGENFRASAAIHRASAGLRSAVHCRTGSIPGPPPVILLSAQMAASLAWLLVRCMRPAGPACASMVPGSKSHPSPRLGLGHKPGLIFRKSPRSESRENHAGKLANVFHIPLSMTPELALKLC